MAHILHAVTLDDGTFEITLEPPAWESMTYEWTPVPISNIFEAYSGAATKQINSGATQKWRLSIDVTGKDDPPWTTLDLSLTWLVTIIDRESYVQTQQYTLWCVGPPKQTINAGTARRAWRMEFRQE